MFDEGNSGGANYKVATSHMVETLEIDVANSFVP